jgi:cell division protein FtsQ
MQMIHLAVAQLAWVDSVTVKRIWPDAIDIKIKERKPYSRWGENSLITEQGVVFTPSSIEPFQSLPLLTGPATQQAKVVEIVKGIKTTLADQAFALAEFSINDRQSWKIKLTSGLDIRLGREEQLKKLQRFLKTLALVGQDQVNAMAIVDLRYPNGYAVSWKPDTPEIDWQAVAHPEKQPITTKKSGTE